MSNSKGAFEGLAEQRQQPIEHGDGVAANEQFPRRPVPENGHRLAAQESAILGFLFEPFLGQVARFTFLPGAGDAAGIVCGQGLQLDLGIGPHQVGGNGLRVDAHGEVQGVIDEVLGQVKLRVQDVIGGDPADDRAIGGDLPLLPMAWAAVFRVDPAPDREWAGRRAGSGNTSCVRKKKASLPRRTHRRLFTDVRHESHEPGPLDGVLDGPLKGGAVAAAIAAEELALAGAHLLQPGNVLVVHEGGPRAAFLGAESAAIFSATSKLFANHS